MSMGVLTSEAIQAFRDCEDGLSVQELGARIGTRWPERVVRAMVRDGYVLGEEHGRLYLAGEPGVERTASNPPDHHANPLPLLDGGAADALARVGSKAPEVSGDARITAPASGSLDAEALRLFDVPRPPSAYREAA